MIYTICNNKQPSVDLVLPDNMEEQLIIAIENHPILYDKSLSTYKSVNARETAWKEVAKDISSSGKFI